MIAGNRTSASVRFWFSAPEILAISPLQLNLKVTWLNVIQMSRLWTVVVLAPIISGKCRSSKFYSQIFKERANGMHSKEDVLAIVFVNIPFGTDLLYETPSTFSWRWTRFLSPSVAFSSELAEFLSLSRIAGTCVQQLTIFRSTLYPNWWKSHILFIPTLCITFNKIKGYGG